MIMVNPVTFCFILYFNNFNYGSTQSQRFLFFNEMYNAFYHFAIFFLKVIIVKKIEFLQQKFK